MSDRVQMDLFDARRRKRAPRAPVASEHQEQAALMAWARIQEQAHPELALLHAIPNGGWRHKAVAAGLKREGAKPGVPDLDLPVARGPWHGLRIELKRTKGGVLSEAQAWWIDALRAEGYRVEVCAGWVAASAVILDYLAK